MGLDAAYLMRLRHRATGSDGACVAQAVRSARLRTEKMFKM